MAAQDTTCSRDGSSTDCVTREESVREEALASSESVSPAEGSHEGEGKQGKGSRNKRKFRSETPSRSLSLQLISQDFSCIVDNQVVEEEADADNTNGDSDTDGDTKSTFQSTSPSTQSEETGDVMSSTAIPAVKPHSFPDDVRMIRKWLCQNIPSIPFLRPGGRVADDEAPRSQEASGHNEYSSDDQGRGEVGSAGGLPVFTEESKPTGSADEAVHGEPSNSVIQSKAATVESTVREACGWDESTESKLEELLLEKLGTLCNESVAKIIALGYDTKEAKEAVIKYGSCYGDKDALSNIVNNALNMSKTMESFGSPLNMQRDGLAKLVKKLQALRGPELTRGDAMWCLLMSDLDVSKACHVELDSTHIKERSEDSAAKDNGKTLETSQISAPSQQHSQGARQAVTSTASPATGPIPGSSKVKQKHSNGAVHTKTASQATKEELSKVVPGIRSLEGSDSAPAVVKACMEAILGAGATLPSPDVALNNSLAGFKAAVEAVHAEATGHGIDPCQFTGPVARQVASQLASQVLGCSQAKDPQTDSPEESVKHVLMVKGKSSDSSAVVEQSPSSAASVDQTARSVQASDATSSTSTPACHGIEGSTSSCHPDKPNGGAVHSRDCPINSFDVTTSQRSNSGSSNHLAVNGKHSSRSLNDVCQTGSSAGDLLVGPSLVEALAEDSGESVAGVVARFDRLNATHAAVLEQCVLLEKRVVELEAQSEEKRDRRVQQLEERVRELEKLLEERKEWAQQKVMQAARRLLKDSAELKALRAERDEAARIKKERAALEDTLRKASGQVDRANAAVRRLEGENAEVRAEMQAANLRANEAAVKLAEVVKREGKAIKKALAWEKQKLKLLEECAEEKRKCLLAMQQNAVAKERQLQAEVLWRQEDKAKEEALAKAETEKRAKEQVEAAAKKREEALRKKADADTRRYREDIERLEREVAQLRVTVGATMRSRDPPGHDVGPSVAHSHVDGGKRVKVREVGDGHDGGGVRRERECVMCMSEEGSVVFLPCAHQVVCRACSDLHEQRGMRDCPSCRTLIQQRIRVFGAA